MIIVELSSGCRRQPTVGGADSSVGPVTHIISPDHSLQLSHSVVLRFVLTAVEQLFFHSCPHTFTACIIMTSSAGTVHALNDSIFLYSSLVLFACILTASVRVMIQPLYQDMICLRFQEYGRAKPPILSSIAIPSGIRKQSNITET